MPVADAGQIPMFSDDDPGLQRQTFKALLDLCREQAQALREAQVVTRELLQNARDARNGTARAERAKSEPALHGPLNPQHRTWRGFVRTLQELERRERRGNELMRVTKAALAKRGPDSARTIRRTMQGYGLKLDNWPPSTWNPDEERVWTAPPA
jgi:hypothetical protein